MPPPARLLSSLEALPSRVSASRYVCTNCRYQYVPRNLQVSYQTRRHKSSEDLPLSERVRRRIWGTDNPPGMKDPYGGESFLEKKVRESKAAKQPNEPEEVEEAAPLAEEATLSEGSEYVPAKTWEGLEHVGSTGQWWEQPPSQTDTFYSFVNADKVTDPRELSNIMHQAVVELCIMKEINKPLTDVCQILAHETETISFLNTVEVKAASDSSATPTLHFPDEAAKASVLESFKDIELDEPIDEKILSDSAESVEPVAETESLSMAPEILQPTTTGYLDVALDSPEFKFALLKRATQLTGHIIPDNEIASMTNSSSVLNYLIEVSKPKPLKLAEQLVASGQFTSLPNVKIFDRRQTPIDQEKEVGRWKVIEAELIRRGLPTVAERP